MRFQLGELAITPGAIREMTRFFGPFAILATALTLDRFSRGDWGDNMDPEDAKANEDALEHGGRLMGVFRYKGDEKSPGFKIWIITEADRSVTTILLPEEY